MTKFVLIGHGRSGTTWLGDLLRNHLQASCLLEPMVGKHLERLKQHHYYWPDDDNVWLRPGDGLGVFKDLPDYFEQYIWTILREARGVKLPMSSLWRHPGLMQYLMGIEGLRIIRTERNWLRQVMSGWHAEKLRDWNSEDADAVKPRSPQQIPWEWVETVMQGYERSEEVMETFVRGRPCRVVHYSDLVDDLTGTMDGVCEFLGISPEATYTTTYQKMTPQTFEELVTNHARLRQRTPPKWQKYWEQDKT